MTKLKLLKNKYGVYELEKILKQRDMSKECLAQKLQCVDRTLRRDFELGEMPVDRIIFAASAVQVLPSEFADISGFEFIDKILE